MFRAAAARYAARRVSHEELRALVPDYAAGDLDWGRATAVRAHLVSGCGECLTELFSRPVGLPRPALGDGHPLVAKPGLARRIAAAAFVVVLLGLVGLTAWTIVELHRGEVESRRLLESLGRRVSETEKMRAGLAARAAALERDLAAARDEVARHAAEAAAGADAIGRLRLELGTAQDRIEALGRSVRRRDVEIGRLMMRAGEQDALSELLASPRLDIIRLRPVAPFRDVRGHVLWQPGGAAIVVYAFGLPHLRGGGRYRVRLELDGDGSSDGPAFVATDGAVVLAVPMPSGSAHLRGVEVVQDTSRDPILAGHTGDGAS